jgi:hypothetical protein
MGRTPERKAEPYRIVAVDGADDDGGTMYYLYDAGRVIAASAWPQPLERIAYITGHSVFSATWGGGEPDDAD